MPTSRVRSAAAQEEGTLWRTAHVAAVLVDGWFNARMVHDDDWVDWFTWQEEGIDWRRRSTGGAGAKRKLSEGKARVDGGDEAADREAIESRRVRHHGRGAGGEDAEEADGPAAADMKKVTYHLRNSCRDHTVALADTRPKPPDLHPRQATLSHISACLASQPLLLPIPTLPAYPHPPWLSPPSLRDRTLPVRPHPPVA